MILEQRSRDGGVRRRMAPLRRWALLTMLVMGGLGGCAGTPGRPEPREAVLAAEPRQVLAEGLQVLIERGFVIRHADLDLGRLDAVLATWPGYQLRLEILATGEGETRVFVSGYRDRQPLMPESLDVLLVALLAKLQARLPAAP